MKEHIGFNRESGVSIRSGICAFFLATTALGWSLSANAGAIFIPIDFPGSNNTRVFGINKTGSIAGSYKNADEVDHGFVRDPYGAITEIDDVGSVGTLAESIDDGGSIAGIYFIDYTYRGHGFVRAPDGTVMKFDPKGSTDTEVSGINKGSITGSYRDWAGVYHGFVRKPDGKIKTIDPSGSSYTTANGINGSGWIAGYYEDNAGGHGYLRDPHGTFTAPIDVPGANGTSAFAINGVGSVAGTYGNANDRFRGFVRTADGDFTKFHVPNARCGFTPTGINRKGVIAGSYYTNLYLHCYDHVSHSFVRATKGKITEFDPPGSGTSTATGINDDGDIVGYYDNYPGQHGYLRTP